MRSIEELKSEIFDEDYYEKALKKIDTCLKNAFKNNSTSVAVPMANTHVEKFIQEAKEAGYDVYLVNSEKGESYSELILNWGEPLLSSPELTRV